MTANLLLKAGLYLGESLVPGNQSNLHGHFEDADIVRFHDKLLAARGLTWQVNRPFLAHVSPLDWQWMADFAMQRSREGIWGFKDPRLCLFTHLWKQVIPSARILFVYRPPAECVYSLKKRSARELMSGRGAHASNLKFWQELDLGLSIYHCYTSMFLRHARHFPSDIAFVSRQALIDGFDLMDALKRLWGIELDAVPIDQVFDPEITGDSGGVTFATDKRLLAAVNENALEIESRLLETKT
ncbi:MAG: hypothetical protein O3A63_18655 [Proteobacteria bacterium]|nr:hypothetical protein [Pseudomonadota bacterium]